MITTLLPWIAFTLFILCMLAIDLDYFIAPLTRSP